MAPTMMAETLLLTAVGFLLVLLNGFFVAAAHTGERASRSIYRQEP